MFAIEALMALLKGRGKILAEAFLAFVIVFGLFYAVHLWSQSRFKAGYQSRQAEINALVEAKNKDQAELQASLQRRIDDIATRAAAQSARSDALIADLAAYGDGMRNKIARASAPRLPARPTADGTCPVDDRAPALGQLLGSCTQLAEGLGADAERLADRVRGLQSYAHSVEQQADECFKPDATTKDPS
jgi:hypothetical protein